MKWMSVLMLVCLVSAPVFAQEEPASETTEARTEKKGRGFLLGTLLYLPNRLFDLTDIVRARLRVAPGFAVQARATDVAALGFGGYAGVYAGIPGPRGEPKIAFPVGFEAAGGAQVSALKAGSGPHYAPFEVGAGFQALIVGLDVGLAPDEALDFITSIFLWDFKKDDF